MLPNMFRLARPGIACIALLLAMLLIASLASAVGSNETALVSRADGANGAKQNLFSSDSSERISAISADGRFVAFSSHASNLDADDTDENLDIFVRDLQQNETTLVNRADGANGAKGNNGSFEPSISADGRFVAFSSVASNLDPDDTGLDQDVYVRDLQQNTTTLVSRADGAAGAKGNGFSFQPSISADGSSVAFTSDASNLDPDDGGPSHDVFVRDLVQNTTELASRADGPGGVSGPGTAVEPSIAPDGQSVSFTSADSTLDPDDTDSNNDIFVRDLVQDDTSLISRASGAGGAKGNNGSFDSSMSSDGSVVAFRSDSSNLHPDDPDGNIDVFVRDLVQNTTMLASRRDGTGGSKANGLSFDSAISEDGQSVAFSSGATNLDPDDTDALFDVFVRDLTQNTTILASRANGAGGAKGNGSSHGASISEDGGLVAFVSSATNLHPDDMDTLLDVFVRGVSGGPLPVPTDKAQCKKGGWQNYPHLGFKNQGDCVSFVATGGRNQPG